MWAYFTFYGSTQTHFKSAFELKQVCKKKYCNHHKSDFVFNLTRQFDCDVDLNKPELFFWLQISLSLLNKILQIDNQSATNPGFESVAIEMLRLDIIFLLI